MTNKTALVTGAGGFIGGHLVRRLLDEGYGVTAIDRKPPHEWWQLHTDPAVYNVTHVKVRDLNLESLLRSDRASEVYHLAADMGGIGYITSHLTSCAANVIDTVRLLEACHEGQRVFFSSSACVYPMYLQNGMAGGNVPLRESDVYPADPEPGYGWEKLYGEQLMAWHRHERGVETRVARYHNVAGTHGSWVGGREKAPAAISRKVATAVLTGDHSISIWGDGNQTRSFMDVEDCVTGTLLIARGEVSEPLNLGSDRWVTVDQLVTIIETIAGVQLTRHYLDEMPRGVKGRNSDNTLIKAVYGWAPSNDLERWLEPVYRWVYDQVAKQLQESSVS